MRRIILGIIFAAFAILASTAEAQTTLAVDINRAQLRWQHGGPTVDAPLEEFRVKCGGASKTYTRQTTLTNPAARSIPIRDAIAGSGDWYCAVSAANKFGESGNSNEVFFAAGAVPSSPTNAEVVVP